MAYDITVGKEHVTVNEDTITVTCGSIGTQKGDLYDLGFSHKSLQEHGATIVSLMPLQIKYNTFHCCFLKTLSFRWFNKQDALMMLGHHLGLAKDHPSVESIFDIIVESGCLTQKKENDNILYKCLSLKND